MTVTAPSRARLLLAQGLGGASAALLLMQGFVAPIETPRPPLIHHAAVGGSTYTGPSVDLEEWLRRQREPASQAPDAAPVAARTALRRRREEELLLLLIG